MFDRNEIFARLPELAACRKDMEKALALLSDCAKARGVILTCGNGGSAADSGHIAGELMKGFLKKRPLSPEEKARFAPLGKEGEALAAALQNGVRAVPIPDATALLTAAANDIGGEFAFAEAAWNYADEKSVLLAISTSGNAGNVCLTAIAVKARGGKVIALTGRDGGKLAALADSAIRVPEQETYRVQELHLPVYHWLCAALEEEIFDE